MQRPPAPPRRSRPAPVLSAESLVRARIASVPAGDPGAMLYCLEQVAAAAETPFPIIGAARGRLLDEAVRGAAARPGRGALRVLELGGHVGYSALRILLAAGPAARLVTVEAAPERHALASAVLRRAGLADRAALVLGTARQALQEGAGAVWAGAPYDLLHIDHAKGDYLPALLLAEPLLAPGALVVADNALSPSSGMAAYLRHVRDPAGAYRSSALHLPPGDPSDGVEISSRRP